MDSAAEKLVAGTKHRSCSWIAEASDRIVRAALDAGHLEPGPASDREVLENNRGARAAAADALAATSGVGDKIKELEEEAQIELAIVSEWEYALKLSRNVALRCPELGAIFAVLVQQPTHACYCVCCVYALAKEAEELKRRRRKMMKLSRVLLPSSIQHFTLDPVCWAAASCGCY
ncbi:hypothetical protein HPB52_001079 [Rhipicephalus sanguineus]|uniref:Uncharacterized protein n=1 Tax=Rhipicephalus sanguineus TaxID=34632 RepID=A0A9D4T6E9_RHISA|nr:hypothetical protein HPB52_001079 [Rhipicephalus sanguineus]